MNIFVRRPGEISNRYYHLEKARLKLAQGMLTPDDMAWCKGLSEWGPLAKVLAVAEGRPRQRRAGQKRRAVDVGGDDARRGADRIE